MDIFHIKLLQNLFIYFEKTENKWIGGRGWHILKNQQINVFGLIQTFKQEVTQQVILLKLL